MAEHSANEGVLKATGQRFYSGAFDPIDGHILEVHSFEQAVAADHHHSFYFTPAMVEKMREETAAFFWIARKELHTMWRQSGVSPVIRVAILRQIEISEPYAQVEGMNTDMVQAPTDRDIILFTVNNGSVIPSVGYFRDDDVVWGFVKSDKPDIEVNAIGWKEK